ncbi:MAG: hypothetical protein RMJ67_06430 [Elusimicrobiota bacterium]|nr:hypothetical protein [Endomicrobiia bacterium]MDW8166130.1 hypothetical protein [Elusimicrobiota bacterium]
MNNIIIFSSIVSTLAIIVSAISWLLLKINDIPHLKEQICEIRKQLKELELKIYQMSIEVERIKILIKNSNYE